jgi:hypothetical protein
MDRRVRSVQRGRQARGLGFDTGASGDPRDRRVRSGEQRVTKSSDAVRVRSYTIGRVRWSRVLTGLAPDAVTVASGGCEERVRSCLRGRGYCAHRRVRWFATARPVGRLTVGAQ